MYKVTKTAEISNFIFKFENELKYEIDNIINVYANNFHNLNEAGKYL